MNDSLYKFGRISGYPGLIVCLNYWLELPYERYNWNDGQQSGYIQILNLRNNPIKLTEAYKTYDGITKETIIYNGFTHIEVVMNREYFEPIFPKLELLQDKDYEDLEDISYEIYFNREEVLKILLNQLRIFLDYYSVVKLATELSRRPTGKTLYILDEPTTGLSFEDVAALLRVLQRLVDAGNTVIVIEHHLDVIKNADYIIDLGPGAGDRGGYIVATGTPEEIAQEKSSATGQYLTRVLHRDIEYAVTS